MFKKEGVLKEYTGILGQRKLLIAITTLMGTIIGAGILGIPYIVAKAGVLYGFILILIIGISFIFLNLFAGEMILRTKGKHQLTGYAEKYLGPWGKRVMVFSMVVAIYGALTAYILGSGEALHTVFNSISPIIYSLLFFLLTSFIIYKGITATGRTELILITLLVAVVGIIGFLSLNNIKGTNFSPFNPAFIFLPYGVILFSFMATPAIPEIKEVLGKKTHLMKKAIIFGSIIPIILYMVFTFIVIGVVGLENFDLLAPNQRIATIALSVYSNPLLGLFANILAILAMFTSFLTLALALLQVYHYDYHISKGKAFLLTLTIPLLIVLFNLTSFIAVLGITGAVAGGLDGILVVLMYWRAKKMGDRKPEYSLPKNYFFGGVLILMFISGIIYQLVSSI